MTRIGIDIGGTFTDFLVHDDGRPAESFKVLSTPGDPSEAFLEGLDRAARARGLDLPSFLATVSILAHGTTVTTNAVLTRSGAPTALLTTEGVRDALEMRRGVRERQYDNRYPNAVPVVPRYRRVGVGGRIGPQGEEIDPLDEEAVAAAAHQWAADGVESVAICFMNAFAEPAHERRAEAIVREILPGAYRAVSTRVLPVVRFYDRVSTTALDAYVGPVLGRYLGRLAGRLAHLGFKGALLLMQSSGGLADSHAAHPVATLLSGPAAGPRAGHAYAGGDCVLFDMGGTSFDASLVRGGQAPTVTEGDIARLRVAVPMLAIHTIGAGGGSVASVDAGGLLRVGPRSAGAAPGPAAYGRGGTEATVTDADLVLGRLDPDRFAGGDLRLDLGAARRAVLEHVARPLGLSIEEAAAGIARVVDATMAHGLRAVTVRQGYDPRDFPVVVAGGAGPLHACGIARQLGVRRLVVPADSSVLCAAGMLMSDLGQEACRSLVGRLDHLRPDAIEGSFRSMAAEARERLLAQGAPPEKIEIRAVLDLRYARQYHEVRLEVPASEVDPLDVDGITDRFHAEHDRLFGYHLRAEAGRAATPVEVINLRVRATGRVGGLALPEIASGGPEAESARAGARPVWLDGTWSESPVYDGDLLLAGMRLQGPCLVDRPTTTILVESGFQGEVDRHGTLHLEGPP